MSRKRRSHQDALAHFGTGSNVNAYVQCLNPDGEERGRVLHVPLHDIAPAPWQPRVYESPERMAELAASIERHGMLHPITVRLIAPRPGAMATSRYEVVAGHRRLEAVRRIALEQGRERSVTVPVLVKELDELEARLLTHVENLDRDDLCAWEMARSIDNVRMALAAVSEPHDVRSVADRVARAAGTISEYLQIATAVTETLLRAGGACTPDGDLDVALVHQMTKGELLRVAKAVAPARPDAMRALVDRLRCTRGSDRRRTRRSKSDSPGAVASGQPTERRPRFIVDQLRNHGRFTMNLTKPFSTYSSDEARGYLSDLLPAFAVLSDLAAGECPWLLHRAGNGLVLYVRVDVRLGDGNDLQEALLNFMKSTCGSIKPEVERSERRRE